MSVETLFALSGAPYSNPIRQALKRLKPRERDLLEMKYFSQLDDEKISRQLRISRNSVRYYLTLARRALKLWHPIHFIIVLIVMAGTVWSLYGTMYAGAPFLREGMIAAWADVLEQEDPREYVMDQCEAIDSILMELQSDYMQSGSDAEKESALSSIHEMERMEGHYSNSLPRDFMVLSRIEKRVDHIASLKDVWENEQAVLKRAIKRKGTQDESTKAMQALSERYTALSVPEYANIDPYESLIRWNTSYAYIILVPVMWIVAQSFSIEKKTGLRFLFRREGLQRATTFSAFAVPGGAGSFCGHRAGIPCDSQFRPFCGERHLAAPGKALSGNRAGIRLSRGQQGYREKRILRAEGQQLGIAPVSGTESGRHAVPMVRFPAEKVEKAAGRTVQNQ